MSTFIGARTFLATSMIRVTPRRPQVSISPQFDGGRAALAGFLYQIVGLLGLRATVRGTGAAGDESDLEALVKLITDGRASHEGYGSDVLLKSLLEGEAGLSFVQFKYSRRVP